MLTWLATKFTVNTEDQISKAIECLLASMTAAPQQECCDLLTHLAVSARDFQKEEPHRCFAHVRLFVDLADQHMHLLEQIDKGDWLWSVRWLSSNTAKREFGNMRYFDQRVNIIF